MSGKIAEMERLECFEKWWHQVGSGISPNDGHEDIEEFAYRVTKMAWSQRGFLLPVSDKQK